MVDIVGYAIPVIAVVVGIEVAFLFSGSCREEIPDNEATVGYQRKPKVNHSFVRRLGEISSQYVFQPTQRKESLDRKKKMY